MLRFGKLEEDVEVRDGDVAGDGNVDAIEVESADTLLKPLNKCTYGGLIFWERM